MEYQCPCTKKTQDELTKHYPFEDYTAMYHEPVSPGLIDINVQCSSCKYFDAGARYVYSMDSNSVSEEQKLYDNHCHVVQGMIHVHGICRFWSGSNKKP